METIKLSKVIGNGMVLQREVKNCIWGYAPANDMIRLTMGAYQTAAKADGKGYFELWLPEMKAGGPWQLQISNKDQSIWIRDVLFGDVFLLGGQSNMELPMSWVKERYEKEYRYAQDSQIRMFDVPKEYMFGEKRELLEKGRWVSAVGEEIAAFSAVGYFAAKKIQEMEGVPIGLLQTAVGGTPVKAWCCEETIEALGLDAQEIEECKDREWVSRQIDEELKREEAWIREATALFGEQRQRGAEGTLALPNFFEGGALEGFIGSLRLTKSFTLDETIDWSKAEAKLHLGAVIDADVTYINGKKIGETTFRYPPRCYFVPSETLRGGRNEIEIQMLVYRGQGGFMPGKKYELQFADGTVVSLEGEWNCEVIQPMPYLPDMTFFQYKACGLYNGMLYPLRRQKVRGCFFYQGESNSGRPQTYEEEFTQMVSDWRRLWQQEELPFISVQLAGFSDGVKDTAGIGWAQLREAQLATEKITNTRLVQAYDLGEYNDLHPMNKKSVGERIARAGADVIYGRISYEKGPSLLSLTRSGNECRVTFQSSEPLCVCEKGADRDSAQQVNGFELVAADGSVHTLRAELESEREVLVHLPQGIEPEYLRYAWNDCPSRANLYSALDLPAVPFERKV